MILKLSPPVVAALLLATRFLSSTTLDAAEPDAAKRPANADSSRVEKLVIIVHPCPYEIYHRNSAPGSATTKPQPMACASRARSTVTRKTPAAPL